MEYCKTCKHWTPYTTRYPANICAKEDQRNGGICDSVKMTEDYGRGHGADMMVYSYSESGEFWTGPDFGCVNHGPNVRAKPPRAATEE